MQDLGVDSALSVIELQPGDQLVPLEAGRMTCVSGDIKQFSAGVVVFESGDAVEHLGFIRDVFGVPCLLRADDYAGNGHVQVVDVVKVAPVGDQHALRMVCAP